MSTERPRIMPQEQAIGLFTMQLKIFPDLLDEVYTLSGGSVGLVNAIVELIGEEISFDPVAEVTRDRIRKIVGVPPDQTDLHSWRESFWQQVKESKQEVASGVPVEQVMAITQLVYQIFNVELPLSSEGYQKAIELMEKRSIELQPPFTEEEMIDHITQKDSVNEIEAELYSALSGEDYANALRLSNHLRHYGEVEENAELGDSVALKVLEAHRRFGNQIFEMFISDPFVGGYSKRILPDIIEAQKIGDGNRELKMWAGVIHIVAGNDSLGPTAKQFVDPFAIVQRN